MLILKVNLFLYVIFLCLPCFRSFVPGFYISNTFSNVLYAKSKMPVFSAEDEEELNRILNNRNNIKPSSSTESYTPNAIFDGQAFKVKIVLSIFNIIVILQYYIM